VRRVRQAAWGPQFRQRYALVGGCQSGDCAQLTSSTAVDVQLRAMPNKIIDKGRAAISAKDNPTSRVPLAELPDHALASHDGTPSQPCRGQRTHLRSPASAQSRRTAPARNCGNKDSSGATSRPVGGEPDALRKRLARASALVAEQLGLVEDEHE